MRVFTDPETWPARAFDELAAGDAGPPLSASAKERAVSRAGTAMKGEVDMGSRWPTCGCASRGECCQDVRVVRRRGSAQYLLVASPGGAS